MNVLHLFIPERVREDYFFFPSSPFHVRSVWLLSVLLFGSLANIKSSSNFECTLMFLFS